MLLCSQSFENGAHWLCGGVEGIADPFTRGMWPAVVIVELISKVYFRIALLHFTSPLLLPSSPHALVARPPSAISAKAVILMTGTREKMP